MSSGIAVIMLASANAGYAQSYDVALMDEIVVTGQHLYSDRINALKTPTPIIDVPQSLSIVTADQITNQGFDSVGDLINYLPGVTNSQGEGHRDAVVFRGVRSTADFYVDGVRDDVQYYRGLYNLEQIEVLRGANALLFGRGGTGGLINRVTKKGQIGKNFTGFKAAIDTFGGYGVELDKNFSINETSALRLNGAYEGLNNHRDFFDGERLAVNPTARILLSPATTLDISYEYIDNERFIDRGIPTGIYASAYNPATNIVTVDGYLDTTQRTNFNLSGDLIGEFTTGNIGHTIVVGAEYQDTSNDNDRFNTFFDQTSDDNETFFAVRPLELNGGVGVNASGNITRNSYSADLNDDTEADVKVFSIFVQDEISLSEHFDIILGARFDSFDITSVDTKANPNVTRARKDEEISPRLGLIYKPQENMSFYGSFSQSFLPRSGGQFASLSSSSEVLNPDVFENLEAGIKWDFGQDLSLTAAVFKNEQTQAARDDVNAEEFEIRGLEIEGFELQIDGHLTEQLYIRAGYANMKGTTDQGRELPRELPENTFSIWSNYQVTDKFGLGLGATYQDDAFITDFDLAVDGNMPDSRVAHPTLPSFTRFDAAAYYDVNEDLRVQVNIENLTDTLYFPTSHSTHQATVGAPLNARFTVSGKF